MGDLGRVVGANILAIFFNPVGTESFWRFMFAHSAIVLALFLLTATKDTTK